MVKFIGKSVCMMLVAALCAGSLSAQFERGAPDSKRQQHNITKSDYADVVNDNFFIPLRGGNSEVILTSKTSPFPAYKGTVNNPFGPQIGTSGGSVQCLEYIDGVLYGVRYASGNQFGTFNPSNGAFTIIKSGFHTQGSDGASMAYNPVNGLTYVFPWTGEDSMGPRFGTVDLATGDFTTIATWALDGQKTYYAAIDEDGICYAVRNLSNQFGTIDLATGNFTVKATLSGITSINYIQDMCFDREKGDLYWVGQADFNSIYGYGYDNYYKVNKNTGALTILGPTTIPSQAFRILTWFQNNDCPTVTNVNAQQINGTKAKITWTAPNETSGLTSYKIYSGTTEIGDVPVGTTIFITGNLAAGTYTFGVEAIYNNGCDPVKVNTNLTIKTCDAITGIDVQYSADCKATVTWNAATGNPKYNVYLDDELVAENIETASYTHNVTLPEDTDMEWCITQVCSAGGESELSCKTAKCVPSPPCNPVTDLTVEFFLVQDIPCAATLKWSAAADMPDAKYNIYKEGVIIATNITETEYIDNFAGGGITETWTVKTVCLDGEAEGVDVQGICEIPNIDEIAISVTIYPNPANSTITIQVDNFLKVEVYNTVGQLVETQYIQSFDVHTYETGIYFFKVYDVNNNSVTKRVMMAR